MAVFSKKDEKIKAVFAAMVDINDNLRQSSKKCIQMNGIKYGSHLKRKKQRHLQEKVTRCRIQKNIWITCIKCGKINSNYGRELVLTLMSGITNIVPYD